MEQHPPCSLQGCLDQLSRIYSAGQAQPLVLDARPSQVYHQQRLQSAANVPLLHLRARCFLLPDKNTPFVVLIPSNRHYTIVNDQQQHGQVQDDGSTSICLAGTSGLEEFLTSRRWQVSCALQDVPSLWEAAAQLQLLEGPLPPALLARRWLFRPAAILEQNINRVEQVLLSQQVQAGRRSGHHRVFRALDLGCGSGRDVVWLASRHRTAGDADDCAGGPGPAAATNNADSPQQAAQTAAEVQVAHLGQHASASNTANGPQGVQQQGASCHEQQQEQQEVAPPEVVWQVVGLDEWHGALVRGQQLAEQAGLPPMATCWCMARVDPVTGQLVQLALPVGSPLAQQAPACTWTGEAAAGDGCAADSDGLQLGSFDLLLCVRFLERALLPVLPSLLRPGGVLLYCTFVEGPGLAAYGRPTGRDRVLAPGELRTSWFGEQQGFKVLQDEVVLSDDGRELSMYAAVKL